MERLDRAFASTEWINQYHLYYLRNLPIIRSVHGPIILDFEHQTPFRIRPFRFEHMWITHPSCRDMVSKAWEWQSSGSRAVKLRNKFNNIKIVARKWNREVFGRVEIDIKSKIDQLQQLQNSINSLEDIRKERQLREEIEDLLDKEELKWAQKARTNWILYGDRNTKYFQTIVKQQRANNRILQLKDGDGIFTDNLDEIENILLSHFKSNYEDCSSRSVDNILEELQPLNIPTLTDEQHLSLNKPITDFEIECAVFQLGAHKAPGPNGIPAFFLHAYWDIMKEDVTRAVQAFFHSGSLFKPLNHSYIVLIPKKPFPDEVSHFRPISLCNVIYKVISKVMVNRLKPIMDSLITPYQNAFIQG